MRLIVVGDLIAHAGPEAKRAAISQFGVQLAFEAQEDMPFHAPVIGQVSRGVLNHAHTDAAEIAGSLLSLDPLPAMRNYIAQAAGRET
jgi:hypothetical protein